MLGQLNIHTDNPGLRTDPEEWKGWLRQCGIPVDDSRVTHRAYCVVCNKAFTVYFPRVLVSANCPTCENAGRTTLLKLETV